MPKKDGLTDSLERARDHLGGDKKGADASKAPQTQDLAAGGAGDKPGEGRTLYNLDAEEARGLRAAEVADAALPQGTEVKPDENVRAFIAALAEARGFIATTAEWSDGDYKVLTAWPLGSDPQEIAAEDMILDTSRIEEAVNRTELALATLKGDVRDTLLDIFRNRQKPWDAHSQDEKRDLSRALEFCADQLIRRVVMAVAADGRPAIQATLDKHTNKGEGEIAGTFTILAASDETILALHHATGKTVMLVTADANAYGGQRKEPVGPDQPALEFEAGTDKPDHPDDDSDLAAGGADDE